MRLSCAVNTRAVATFLRASQQDTSAETFFEGVTRLPAGHFATFDAADAVPTPRIHRYWTLDTDSGSAPNEGAAVAETRALLADSIRLRLRSDVPVGLLLSGGLDPRQSPRWRSSSSAVAGISLSYQRSRMMQPPTNLSLFVPLRVTCIARSRRCG